MHEGPGTLSDTPHHLSSSGLYDQTSLPSNATAQTVKSLYLVDHIDQAACNFWMSFTKKEGEQHLSDLLKITDTETLLKEAAERGMVENRPIMLADAVHPLPRFFYLSPHNESENIAKKKQRSAALAKTVIDWAPTNVGLYFSPSLIDQTEALMIKLHLLQSIGAALPFASFYFLYGDNNQNGLLNIALKVKLALKKEGIDLIVYH